MANFNMGAGLKSMRGETRWQKIKRASKFWFLRVVRLRATPHSIALGVALGIFIGFMPIIPFQSVVVLTLAVIFRGNKLAAWLATFISNPLDMIPFYYLLFLVGDFVLPFPGLAFDPGNLTMEGLIHSGWDLFSVMVAGGLVMGIPASILMYFATLWLVVRYRKRKLLNKLKKQTRR